MRTTAARTTGIAVVITTLLFTTLTAPAVAGTTETGGHGHSCRRSLPAGVQTIQVAFKGTEYPVRLVVPESSGSVAAPDIVAWLAVSGWDADRLAAHRAACRRDGVAWPHAVPGALLVAAGPARWQALLARVRSELGLSGLVATARDPEARPGPAEARLLADVPPHHGPVG